MKKIFLMAVAAMLLAAPATQAQKINGEELNATLAKSDAEIQDVKKNGKSATWVKRAQTIYGAISAPTKGLYTPGMVETLLKPTMGDPAGQGEAAIRTGAAQAYNYAWVDVYLQGGQVVAWTQTREVRPNLYEEFVAAVNKAQELDPKAAAKLKGVMGDVVNFYKQEGNVNYDAAQYRKAADGYIKAYSLMENPAYGAATDPALLYNAGYLLVVDGNTNPESFVLAEQVLRKALENGYSDEQGGAFYYLFHSCYGQAQQAEGEAKAALLQKAKAALTEGIEKYPTNENIISSFLGLYMSEPSVGDASELIGMIESAVARDPQSVEMWSSLALANYQMKNFEAAIAAGQKAAELAPDSFDSNYRQGIFFAAQGDWLLEEINKRNYTRQSDYDADLALSNNAYRGAVPWLEKAFEIDPTNRSVVETLKVICFRLRDEEGMMDKYNKYNTLLKQM